MIRKEKMAGCLPAWHLPGAGRIAPPGYPASPDFRERHVRVDILEARLMSPFHSGEALEELDLLRVDAQPRELGVELHRVEFFPDSDDKAVERL